ncbi:MAG: S-layer homology domain-containing protein, partial [Clostridia bacterium]|nr:S-layer homology domain-containing protein [Clostridia bacterium]
MKKLITFISLCLAVMMALPLVTSCTAGEMPFTDVKAGKWYYDNVKYVYANGIMNGVTDTKFDPS